MLHFLLSLFLSMPHAQASDNNHQILDQVWKIGKKDSCTVSMANKFTTSKLKELKKNVSNDKNRDLLEEKLNVFLKSLNKSHTQFFGPNSEGFHLFRSFTQLTNKKAPPLPDYFNPGLQFYSQQQ